MDGRQINSLLLVIDVQTGFRNVHTQKVIPAIVNEVSLRVPASVVFTQFENQSGSNFERLLSWTTLSTPNAIEIVPELSSYVSSQRCFRKSGYSAFTSPGLEAKIRALDIVHLELCGFDTDACIHATAFDAFDLGFSISVRSDLSASTGGVQCHEAALRIIARNFGEKAVRG